MELQEVIMRLRTIKMEKSRLSEEEQKLSNPMMKDMSDIPTILTYCREAYKDIHRTSVPRRPRERRIYIFILLFLFSPQTLAGGKMGSGIRESIAKAMEIESSNVSHYHSDIWFYYNVYEDFRQDVNTIFEKVFEKLRKNK